jgi:hypothetical protein
MSIVASSQLIGGGFGVASLRHGETLAHSRPDKQTAATWQLWAYSEINQVYNLFRSAAIVLKLQAVCRKIKAPQRLGTILFQSYRAA